MRHSLTTPTSADFYGRYGTLLPTARRTGYFMQGISLLTETGVLFSLIINKIQQVVPEYSYPIALIGSIIGAIALEYGLRRFVPHGVRAILYRRFGGLDLAMTVLILAAAATLLFSSVTLSFKGSYSITEYVLDEPEQQTTDEIERTAKADRERTNSTWKLDSTAIASRYTPQIAAIQQASKAKTNQLQAQIRSYVNRERRTDQSFATARDRLRERIAATEADASVKIAELQADQAAELSNALSTRTSQTERIETRQTVGRDSIALLNATAIEENEATIQAWGGGLGYFTIFCAFVLICCICMEEICYKGSGMEEVASPEQYDLQPSMWVEAIGAVRERINYQVRSRITRFADNTPDAPLPAAQKSLYDGTKVQPSEVCIETEDGEEQVIIIPLRRRSQAQGQTGQKKASKVVPPPVPTLFDNDYDSFFSNATEIPEQVQQAIREQHQRTDPAQNVATVNPVSAAKNYAANLNTVLHKGADTDADRDLLADNAIAYLQRGEELKAEQVIACYLGKDATPQSIFQLKEAIKAYLKDEGPNPFEVHHRVVIQGFRQQRANNPISDDGMTGTSNNPISNNPITDPSPWEAEALTKGMHKRPCLNCGKIYQPKAYNQKFCSNKTKDSCQMQYHAKRHGGRGFNPKRYHKTVKP